MFFILIKQKPRNQIIDLISWFYIYEISCSDFGYAVFTL